MAVFWVSDMMLHKFEWFSTYNLQSKTLLHFHKTNFSHQPSYRLSPIYRCLFFDFLQLSFSYKLTAELMWGFIDVKCKHYSSSILFWLVEFVAQEFKSEREVRLFWIDFSTSYCCPRPLPWCSSCSEIVFTCAKRKIIDAKRNDSD